jgi:hypothetical protein
VRMGEGWGGTLHDLANGLKVWELGPAAAAGVLLSWCEFVVYEVEGREEGRGTMRRMEMLRGAVMTAGIEAVGAGRGGW